MMYQVPKGMEPSIRTPYHLVPDGAGVRFGRSGFRQNGCPALYNLHGQAVSFLFSGSVRAGLSNGIDLSERKGQDARIAGLKSMDHGGMLWRKDDERKKPAVIPLEEDS